MEEKHVKAVVSDDEFRAYVQLAQAGDRDAIEWMIQFYADDIQKACRYIRMPQEDAMQSILADFIAELKKTKKNF